MSQHPLSRTEVQLGVEHVAPEDLSHVWGVLTRVAEGLALDGHEVGVRLYRWGDDGGDPEVELDPVLGEGSDGP